MPEEVSTRQVKVELLPPPCSACRVMSVSSRWASASVYCRSFRSRDSTVWAVFSSGRRGCMIMLSPSKWLRLTWYADAMITGSFATRLMAVRSSFSMLLVSHSAS